ncbi:condensin-2 complex subunit H2 [Gadus morhua]|nr:condensin-2 complex subunit H2 [Gadus morhua]
MESAENRFAHLLQPIRELTKNWDIDVASELNDYLEELDEICIAFDGGKIQLNFAEAALLIQGSTCIYSKKVELLYSLVFQTMDYINDKKQRRDKQAGAADKEVEGDHEADDNDDGDFMYQEIDSSTADMSHESDSTTPVHVAPLAPEALILPETHEKQKLPLISVKGEVLGSHKDFRINTYIPGAQDLILLTHGLAAFTAAEGGPDAGGHNAGGHSLSQPPQEEPVDVTAAPEAPGNHVADGDDDFMPLQDPGEEMDQTPEEHIERQQAPSEGRMLRERPNPQAAQKETEERSKGQQERANAWQLHNPYDVFAVDKPLKTGKCYKVPDGLNDGGKRKRKRPDALQDFRSWFTGLFNPPEHKLKGGPASTDLNYVYLSKVKEKMKTRKRINRKAGVVVSDEELRRTFLQPAGEGAQRGEGEEEDGPEENRLDLQGGDDDGSDNDHEPLDDVPAGFGGGDDFIMPGSQGDELSYEDLVRKSVEQYLVNSKGYAQETALSRRVKEWGDKLRPDLVMQEERPTFDIHDYSDRIVAALGDVGRSRSLASVVGGLDNFEVCKYMLAALQLANDYTVEISSTPGLEESVDTMGLTLLTTHRANDRFKTMGGAI